MGTFLLLLFIFFVVWPLVRLIWRIWVPMRQWQKASASMRDAYRRAAEQQSEETPKARKKKIDPNVGEYVAFEEIACDVKTSETTSNADGTQHTVSTESRVEDAVWEDIR